MLMLSYLLPIRWQGHTVVSDHTVSNLSPTIPHHYLLSEHRATRSLLPSRSLAIRRAPCQLTPISSRSSLKVLRHVFFGLPLFLLPSSGTQYIAVWAGLSLCILTTWPAIFLLLVVTMSWSRSMPALLITSSFVTWSRQEIQRIALRQRR